MKSTDCIKGIEGDFPLSKSVLGGIEIVSAVKSRTSSWARTAKISVILSDGRPKAYFLKTLTGQGARASAEGELHSASAINSIVSKHCPEPAGWGEYDDGEAKYFFYVGDFHDMDFSKAPDPEQFGAKLAAVHRGTSPNGRFGYPVRTVIGKMARTVTWEDSWATSFTHQLNDVINYDNDTNGIWPELDAACKQLISVIIPRLLGALQSDGRNIKPSLVHGDLWENNVGIDTETGRTIVFDPGCTYAHNEMEFGTWRCSWAHYFKLPTYMKAYQRHFKPSEPVEEWDDRNRLYSLHPYLTDSAGHRGSISRQRAYNDILYLCEKYGPLDSLERYDPEKDIVVTGGYVPFVIDQLE